MSEEVPDWAKQRACELANAVKIERAENPHWHPSEFGDGAASPLVAFARYIASKEEPPVDPLLIEAREIAARYCEDNCGLKSDAQVIRSGHADRWAYTTVALAALKRGVELTK